MATTITSALKIEAGTQTVWQTSVTPTFKMMGINSVSFDPGITTKLIDDEIRGSYVNAYTAYVESVKPTIKLGGYVSAEMFPYFLEMFGSKDATPTDGGGPGPYTREMDGALTTTATPRIMTLVYGEAGGRIYKATGVVINKLTVKIEKEKPWMFDAEGFCYAITSGASFGSNLPDTVYTLCTQDDTSVLFAAFGDDISTGTAMDCTVSSYELSLENGRSVHNRVGSLFPCSYSDSRWKGSVKLTLELNNIADELLEEQLTLTPDISSRQFRIAYDNAAVDETQRKVQIDVAVTATKAPSFFEDEENLAIFSWEGELMYDKDGLANYLETITVNNTATLL